MLPGCRLLPLFALAADREEQVRPHGPHNAIYLVNHSRVTRSNEASRFATVHGIAAKFAAHIPLDGVPRVLMGSKSMGSVEGREIAGPGADFLKTTFINAAAQCDPFHRPVSISEAVGNALMINNTSKPIFCMRIKDGIVG